jgi:PAS domain S-box-containing protein
MPTITADSTVLSTLHEVAQLLTSGLDRDSTLQRLIDVLTEALGAERGFLLLDKPGGGLQVEAARNFRKEEIDAPSFDASKTVIDFVSATGESQVVDDAMVDNRTASSASIAGQGLRSIVCVPIKIGDDVVGVLYLDHRNEAARFGRDEMRLLEVVVQQASVAILANRLRQTAQGGQRAAEDLRVYQDAVLSNLNTSIVTLDTHGRITNANPAALTLFDADPKTVRGASFRTFLGEKMSDQLMEAFKGAAAGKTSSSVVVEAPVGNTERYMRCSVSPLRDAGGNITGILLLTDDDTPRVEAEHAREREAAESQRIRELFSKYVPQSVVDSVVNNTTNTRGTLIQKEISVIFADIRGYTTLTERSSPERLMVKLNRYLTVATRCIQEQQGTLDKFMGDGVMAVFNAPDDIPDHPLSAVRAAWAMQKRAARFMEGVSFGVGVNTGGALVGNIGTDAIRNYSCIGDVVNVASRLQGQAEGGNIVITKATYERVKQAVRVQPMGKLKVKGRAEPVEAFQVLQVHGALD